MRKGRGEIKRVGDLFAAYKLRLKAPQKTVIDSFCEVVHDVIGVSVKTSQVRYSPSSRIVSLQVAGPLKQEVRLHKEEILLHLRGRLGVQSAPKDIL